MNTVVRRNVRILELIHYYSVVKHCEEKLKF